MTTGQSLECHLPAPAAIRKCDGKMLIQKDAKEDTLLSKGAKNDNTLIRKLGSLRKKCESLQLRQSC